MTLVSLGVMALAAGGGPAPTWQTLTVSQHETATKRVSLSLEATPDGRVVFRHGDHIAPSVARAPVELVAAISALVKKGLAPASVADPTAVPSGRPDEQRSPPKKPGLAPAPSLGKADWVVRFALAAGKERVASYPASSVPAAEHEVFAKLSELINSKREPLPCPTWNGEGDFTLTLWAQDLGVAPGPVRRTTFSSKGTAEHVARLGADVRSIALEPSEVAALRTALAAVDWSAITSVFEGLGEGHNLRTAVLTFGQGSCARSSTNQFPPQLKAALEAVAPAVKRF